MKGCNQPDILQNSIKAFINLLVSNSAIINIITNEPSELSDSAKSIMFQKIKCWTNYAIDLLAVISSCNVKISNDSLHLADPFRMHDRVIELLEIQDIENDYLHIWGDLHRRSVFDAVIQYIEKELVSVEYIPNIIMLIKHLLNETLFELQELDYIFYKKEKEHDLILYVSDFCTKVEEYTGVSSVKERYIIYKQLLNSMNRKIKRVKVFKYVEDKACSLSDDGVKFEVE